MGRLAAASLLILPLSLIVAVLLTVVFTLDLLVMLFVWLVGSVKLSGGLFAVLVRTLLEKWQHALRRE